MSDESHAALSVEQSVNDTIRQYPSTLHVLNELGVDTCCGGAESLEAAARIAGIQVEDLMTGIRAALERTITPSVRRAETVASDGVVPPVERRNGR